MANRSCAPVLSVASTRQRLRNAGSTGTCEAVPSCAGLLAMRKRATAGGYGRRCLASRMREVSTTPRASKYFRWITLLSHVAAAAVPHATDAATPRATRDAGRAARDERRDSMRALFRGEEAAQQREK